MCPDRELLSAYADGEVPEPWGGRLARHLATCASCAGVVERFRTLSDRLRTQASPHEGLDESAVLSRIGATLEGALAARELHSPAHHGPTLLRRRVAFPLPAVAAAAMVVAALLALTVSGILAPARHSATAVASAPAAATAQPASMQATATAELPPGAAQPSNIDELLRYLDSRNGQVTLTIRLPSDANFERLGAPVLQVSGPPAAGQKDGSQ